MEVNQSTKNVKTSQVEIWHIKSRIYVVLRLCVFLKYSPAKSVYFNLPHRLWKLFSRQTRELLFWNTILIYSFRNIDEARVKLIVNTLFKMRCTLLIILLLSPKCWIHQFKGYLFCNQKLVIHNNTSHHCQINHSWILHKIYFIL